MRKKALALSAFKRANMAPTARKEFECAGHIAVETCEKGGMNVVKKE
jgi:hypothetical protein